MENKQFEMFVSSKPSVMMVLPEHAHDVNNSDQIHITSTDHHILQIVSTYLNKIPDIPTKKHLARIMINFIMKSVKI